MGSSEEEAAVGGSSGLTREKTIVDSSGALWDRLASWAVHGPRSPGSASSVTGSLRQPGDRLV